MQDPGAFFCNTADRDTITFDILRRPLHIPFRPKNVPPATASSYYTVYTTASDSLAHAVWDTYCYDTCCHHSIPCYTSRCLTSQCTSCHSRKAGFPVSGTNQCRHKHRDLPTICSIEKLSMHAFPVWCGSVRYRNLGEWKWVPYCAMISQSVSGISNVKVWCPHQLSKEGY